MSRGSKKQSKLKVHLLFEELTAIVAAEWIFLRFNGDGSQRSFKGFSLVSHLSDSGSSLSIKCVCISMHSSVTSQN